MCKMKKKPILVSACLLGVSCKYSGGDNFSENVVGLAENYQLIPVCPEQMGGLPTPRVPSEVCGDCVKTRDGEDVTAQFQKGAKETLRLAKMFGCECAVLKSRSPSCGSGIIYDGSFSGTKVAGDGITARILKENGIRVFSEEETELEKVIG